MSLRKTNEYVNMQIRNCFNARNVFLNPAYMYLIDNNTNYFKSKFILFKNYFK